MKFSNKQFEVLQWAFSFLKQHQREENIAEILLQHRLHVPREVFYASMQEEIDEKIIEQFKRDIIEHATTGIPVQHLTGEAFFYGRTFQVNEDVLIPRYETEELVFHVIEHVKATYPEKDVTIVDIGTGSGVIAITLALELANATIFATDISEKALQVAQKNAMEKNASVHFLQGNFLEPVIEKGISPQLIVSNPPYIDKAEANTLADTVKNYDPHLALFAGHRGLKAYEDIVVQINSLGERPASLFFEIGYNQAKDVTAIIKNQFPASEIRTIQDINVNDRVIAAKLNIQK